MFSCSDLWNFNMFSCRLFFYFTPFDFADEQKKYLCIAVIDTRLNNIVKHSLLKHIILKSLTKAIKKSLFPFSFSHFLYYNFDGCPKCWKTYHYLIYDVIMQSFYLSMMHGMCAAINIEEIRNNLFILT